MQAQSMFYSPFFQHVRAVSGLGGSVLGTLGGKALFKAAFSTLPSLEYIDQCVCLCDERDFELVLSCTKGCYVTCRGVLVPLICAVACYDRR